MSTTIPKWTEERTTTLESMVSGETPVSATLVAQAAETLNTSVRSVSSKLRKMGYEVESTAATAGKKYSEAEEAEIQEYLEANPGVFTYAEVAAVVCAGAYTAKQIQGKILSMELTDLVKPTPKVEREKKYTEEEEAKLIALVTAGGFIEDIAAAMNRPVPSIRGKILSLSRTNPDVVIPKQREYKNKDVVDPIVALGDSVADMTVEEIAEKIEKTTRGVKTMLTHRAIKCKNWDGEAKAAKIQETNA